MDSNAGFAAAEEHRVCFSLTDIASAKTLGKGEEYFLQGYIPILAAATAKPGPAMLRILMYWITAVGLTFTVNSFQKNE